LPVWNGLKAYRNCWQIPHDFQADRDPAIYLSVYYDRELEPGPDPGVAITLLFGLKMEDGKNIHVIFSPIFSPILFLLDSIPGEPKRWGSDLGFFNDIKFKRRHRTV
jgi:hypothetical protein